MLTMVDEEAEGHFVMGVHQQVVAFAVGRVAFVFVLFE